jgi:hypothetical protein
LAIKFKIILLIFLVWFFSSGVTAEDILKKTSTDSDPLEYTLPEVIVEGDNSMHSLRLEVIRAQELKFEVFNNLNSTDDFDIICDWHAPLGTKIKEWSCDVNYLKKARADAVRDYRQHGAQFPSEHKMAIELAEKGRELNREMKALAVKHPELALAIINAHELEQLYKEEQKKRYGDGILTGNSEQGLVVNKIDIWEAAFMDHSRGLISDQIWERWDSTYRKLFYIKTYQRLWESVNHDKYADEFIKYVNSIIPKR